MGGSRASSPIMVISDDEEEHGRPVSPPVPVAAAVLPDDDSEPDDDCWPPADWTVNEDIPRPDWLPDGFIMETYREPDGKPSQQATGFFCPVSEIRFGTKNEVLDYLFCGGMQRAAEAKNTLDDKTTLQGKYKWLRGNHKWLLEIRAGGENGRKMFKVYAHPNSKVRITSKAEVLRLIRKGKLLDESTNDGDCNDTSNKDNIIAQLDFNVKSLPGGWVKETAFRKCSDGIRTDRYYTDPVTKKVFRSLKAAKQYFMHEKTMDCYKPSMSVTDLYFFDGCMDMPPYLSRRLKMGVTKDQCEEECQTSCLGFSVIHLAASLCSVNDPWHQTLTIQVGEDGKELLHGDSKEKLDEEECHGDDKKEEDKGDAHYGDGTEKQDNEGMLHGDGKEDEDEPGALHGSEEVGVSGDRMPCGDGVKDGWRFRSLTDLYPTRIEKGNSKKGKKKSRAV